MDANDLTINAAQRSAVLARLREGSALSSDLNEICYRYSARIFELRKEGLVIAKERVPDSRLFRYTLAS